MRHCAQHHSAGHVFVITIVKFSATLWCTCREALEDVLGWERIGGQVRHHLGSKEKGKGAVAQRTLLWTASNTHTQTHTHVYIVHIIHIDQNNCSINEQSNR
jgi:hypothetical protein